jgi:transcriptional adapter 2-alpha
MDFDLCVECFSVGVELNDKKNDHKNTHSYKVMDFLAFPLHHPAWGADEEQLLLEGIDMYGIGNWQAVSEHVGEKSPEVRLPPEILREQ